MSRCIRHRKDSFTGDGRQKGAIIQSSPSIHAATGYCCCGPSATRDPALTVRGARP